MAKYKAQRGDQIHQGAARIVRTGQGEMMKELLRGEMSGEGKRNYLPMTKRKMTMGRLNEMITGIQRDITKRTPKAQLKSYKKGGKVKKTGPAYLHKGEMVIPKGMHMMNGMMMSDKEMDKKRKFLKKK